MLTINSVALLVLLATSAYGLGPDPIDLGSADNYAILTKAGVTNTGGSAIYGNVGTSPIAETAITGFALVRSTDNTFSTSIYVVGNGEVTSATHAIPTPPTLTTDIGCMENAYTTAAGQHYEGTVLISPILNLLDGDLTDQLLTPNLYKWTNSVHFSGELTFNGSANDVWILQIDQNFEANNGAKVVLAGEAKAENIFWQVAEDVKIGVEASVSGIFLVKQKMEFLAGSNLTGAVLAQTAVTLISTTIESV